MRRTITPALVIAAAFSVLAIAASAGTAPNMADKNLGTVLTKPNVHNLMWDDSWDAHNPSFTKAQIHTFTRKLLGGSWTSGLTQYGVKSFSFAGTSNPSSKCGSTRAASSVTSVEAFAWATCMVGKGGVDGPAVGTPVSNDVYVVYLPERTTITDKFEIPGITVFGKSWGPWTLVDSSSCIPGSYAAYHAFSMYILQWFPVIIAPTKCFSGSMDLLTEGVSHEIAEAATNPLLALGFIDTDYTFVDRYKKGEIADICEAGTGDKGTTPVSRAGFQVSQYWSNSAGACTG